MCVELNTPEINPSDLVNLQGLLPRNLKGISFSRPPLENAGDGGVAFRSESRKSYVSRYMVDVGQKLLGLGQAQGALRFFDMASRLGPDAEVNLLRSRALVSLGRMDEAHREIDRILRWQPSNGLAHFLLGRIYLNRNDYQSAERYFRTALAQTPEGHELRPVVQAYLEFNQVFQDRDALYGRNLSPQDYAREIQNLQTRVLEFKARIQTSAHAEVRGMEPHLDTLDKLFQHWLAEMGSHSVPVGEVVSS